MPAHALEPFAVKLAGTLLVEASAGTGKTHTITTLFVRLVVERGLSVKEILVVTFTEAATAELRDRIRRRLRSAVDALVGNPTPKDPELADFAQRASAADRATYLERAQRALCELDLAAISTIHSFCLRMLQEHAFESGARFDLSLMPDTSLLVRDVADDYWASKIYELPPSLYMLLSRRFAHDTARRIVETFARRPTTTPVLPEPPDANDGDADAELLAAYADARAGWSKARKRIVKMLSDASVMNQQSYKLAQVEACANELDEWFASDAPLSLPPFKAIEKFTPERIAKGTKGKQAPPHDDVFDKLATLLGKVLETQERFGLTLRLGAVDWVRAELPKRKTSLRAQGFEDLLFSLDAALDGPRGEQLRARIAARFRAALIDEFQDTDPVQYRIFERLFHHQGGALLLVGDPKQSIYAFRGADVFSYTNASSVADASYTLDTNRRSDPSLVAAVNTIFKRVKDPFMLEQIGFEAVVAHETKDRISCTPAFEVLLLPAASEAWTKGVLNAKLPAAVAAEVARFLRSGATIEGNAVRPGDIAILTRTNKQARATQAELRRLQIPTALQSEESVFDSSEARDVELLLRAVLEPNRNNTVRSALSTVVAGVAATELARLETDESEWDRWSEKFRSWLAHWTEHGFIQAYRRMLTELEAEKRLLSLVDGERRVTNLLHLGELLHRVEHAERLGPTALVRWLGLTRAEAEDRENGQLGTEAAELRLETDAHAVQLLTIHKSKGLEFPIVYCPFLWDARMPEVKDVTIDFHDPDDDLRLKIDIDPVKDGPSLTAKCAETRAEYQRLLYVALTRAKHRCSIVWGAINEAEDSPLAYSLHESGERYEKLPDAELRSDVEKLVKDAKGKIGVTDLDLDAPGSPYESPSPPASVALAARAFDRKKVDTWFRVGSFTAMTRREDAIHPEAQGRDHDEADERTSLLPPPSRVSNEPVLLHDFPRGAKAGTMLHEILEELDFTSTDDVALTHLVTKKLTAAGHDADKLAATLAQSMKEVLATPLDGHALKLASLARAKRIDELPFVFPVPSSSLVTAASLANAFDAHPSGALPAKYAERLRAINFLPLRGFLKGFIDLVFEHDGKFFVVDYKSNHLGPKPEDYRSSQLAAAMTHHDYYLQYHLYVVAAHRWLARRLRGYSYETHFGGVYYLFLRGMSPTHTGNEGIFADRPPLARIEALSSALGGAK